MYQYCLIYPGRIWCNICRKVGHCSPHRDRAVCAFHYNIFLNSVFAVVQGSTTLHSLCRLYIQMDMLFTRGIRAQGQPQCSAHGAVEGVESCAQAFLLLDGWYNTLQLLAGLLVRIRDQISITQGLFETKLQTIDYCKNYWLYLWHDLQFEFSQLTEYLQLQYW